MPRFYFHLFNDIESPDQEGDVLPNAAVELQRAKILAREMAAESVKRGHLILEHRIELTNEHGDRIGTRFSDVVDIRESPGAA